MAMYSSLELPTDWIAWSRQTHVISEKDGAEEGVFGSFDCRRNRYSLSNVILADEKFTLFHQYLRYCNKRGTVVFSMPSAIL